MGLRVGVWGTGSIGSRHLRVLSSLEDVVPVALPTRRERVPEWQQQGFAAFADWQDADLDAVVVATGTGRHATDLKVLGDLPVLVEKPLFADFDPGFASREGLFVGCCLRFHPAVAAFRSALCPRDQVVVACVQCKTDLSTWHPGRALHDSYSGQAGQGGALRELIHEVDLAGWLFGWPAEVQGSLGHHWRLGIPDETGATYWDHPAATVRVRLDLASTESVRSIVVQSKDGPTISLDLVEGTVRRSSANHLEALFNRPVDRDEMYREQANAFVTAVRGGDPGPLATGAEGSTALAVVEAVRSSAATGRPAPVPCPAPSTPSSP